MWSDKGDFSKLEFLAKFQVMLTQIFKKSTIKLAFKRTGLIFYHLEIVLLQVCVLLSSTWAITSPPSNPTKKISSVYITTPHRPYKIKNQATILINSMKRDKRLVHPKFQPYLNQFICSSVPNSL